MRGIVMRVRFRAAAQVGVDGFGRLCPWAIASTIEAGPSTTSPPAKTPGTLVASVAASAVMRPLDPVAMPKPAESILCPMATMTVSAFMTTVCDSSKLGADLPGLAGSRDARVEAMAETLPPLLSILAGPRSVRSVTPSPRASATSHG